MKIASFKSPFLKKEKVSKDAWSFYFQKPNEFSYQAGQYVKMVLPIENPDDRGTSRFFTMASSPTDEHIMITTKIGPSSFKQTLGSLKVGDEASFRAPFGQFILNQDDTTPRVFLSGGMGITPFRSMVKFAHDRGLTIPIHILASFSQLDEIVFMNEFEEITHENTSLKITITVTHPENGTWAGEIGRIDETMIKKHIDNYQNCRYYICGPEAFVSGMEKITQALKIKEESVVKEDFPGY